MERITRIQIDHGEDINQAVRTWADHENMNEARLIRWLEQFSDAHLPLAIRLIRNVIYYGAANIRGMTRELFTMAVADLTAQGLTRIAFVPVGEAGSGSATVARLLREFTRGTPHRVLSMFSLSRAAPGAFEAIVFVDDFSGSGKTLTDWWETVEPTVRPIGASIFAGLLVLNGRAREPIETFAEGVFAVSELDEDRNIFSAANRQFNQQEKEQILDLSRTIGAGSKYEMGFRQSGLLVAFRHGCPNNSIPLLWYESRRWRALFNRRSI
jgi:hypothetical protein